jgi:pyruvate/2-oxoglutarate dehydrogenase complex dihydrolipoamide dehydrogenase (E3) component
MFATGVRTNGKGDIETDSFQNTTAEKVYAVGDVIGKWQLTPGVAKQPDSVQSNEMNLLNESLNMF